LVLAAFNPVSATIINVPADSSTIQGGIDGSNHGDTVRVAPGTYVENINFNGKNIVVGSWFLDNSDTSYISTTIIDGSQTTAVVIIMSGEDSTAVITGFTMQNGHTVTGGGIYCESSSPTISYNTIDSNYASSAGGGIYCANSNAIISHNTISENWADYGGGIICVSSNPTIIYNIISGNYAVIDGGGICGSEASPIISHNSISVNLADGEGGGIYCYSGYPSISYNTISGNHARQRGGGLYYNYSSPQTGDNTIIGNLAVDGGGLGCNHSTFSISHCAFIGNWTTSRGGGIFCQNPGSLFIDRCTFYGNSAINGGGISCYDSSVPIITNTIFWDNPISGFEIFNSSLSVNYSDVQGGWA
jgi:parallel beta-helix repeat protein